MLKTKSLFFFRCSWCHHYAKEKPLLVFIWLSYLDSHIVQQWQRLGKGTSANTNAGEEKINEILSLDQSKKDFCQLNVCF